MGRSTFKLAESNYVPVEDCVLLCSSYSDVWTAESSGCVLMHIFQPRLHIVSSSLKHDSDITTLATMLKYLRGQFSLFIRAYSLE